MCARFVCESMICVSSICACMTIICAPMICAHDLSVRPRFVSTPDVRASKLGTRYVCSRLGCVSTVVSVSLVYACVSVPEVCGCSRFMCWWAQLSYKHRAGQRTDNIGECFGGRRGGGVRSAKRRRCHSTNAARATLNHKHKHQQGNTRYTLSSEKHALACLGHFELQTLQKKNKGVYTIVAYTLWCTWLPNLVYNGHIHTTPG